MRLRSCGAQRRHRVGLQLLVSHRPLAHSLEERLRISFLRPGAKIVGYAFTEDVACYGRRACVEIFRVGGLGLCSFEVDEICPHITSVRFAVEGVESIFWSPSGRSPQYGNPATP